MTTRLRQLSPMINEEYTLGRVVVATVMEGQMDKGRKGEDEEDRPLTRRPETHWLLLLIIK